MPQYASVPHGGLQPSMLVVVCVAVDCDVVVSVVLVVADVVVIVAVPVAVI